MYMYMTVRVAIVRFVFAGGGCVTNAMVVGSKGSALESEVTSWNSLRALTGFLMLQK